jgi:putative DNA primase/helicase
VVSATEEYFEAEDALGQWIEERCLLAKPTAKACPNCSPTGAMGRARGRVRGLGQALLRTDGGRKFEKCRLTGGARGITGIALRPKPYSHGYPTEMTEQSGRVTDLTGF